MKSLPYRLILGDKNSSTWSLRPWLLLTHLDLEFDEVSIRLRQDETKAEILKHSPSGFVPALYHRDLCVFDSLAIAEYLADEFPDAGLWPTEPATKAHARAISAEMHSGFGALRREMPMDYINRIDDIHPSADCQKDIDRILHIWQDCRRKPGLKGDFLFGDFTIADAMYAPVVSRFHTYGIRPTGQAGDYFETMWAHPLMQRWGKEAELEVDLHRSLEQ